MKAAEERRIARHPRTLRHGMPGTRKEEYTFKSETMLQRSEGIKTYGKKHKHQLEEKEQIRKRPIDLDDMIKESREKRARKGRRGN